MNPETPTQDRRDLKIEALRQRLAEITVAYEDKDADRRIEITELMQYVQQLQARVAELEATPEEPDVPEDTE